jgi:hypothetical protein
VLPIMTKGLRDPFVTVRNTNVDRGGGL